MEGRRHRFSKRMTSASNCIARWWRTLILLAVRPSMFNWRMVRLRSLLTMCRENSSPRHVKGVCRCPIWTSVAVGSLPLGQIRFRSFNKGIEKRSNSPGYEKASAIRPNETAEMHRKAFNLEKKRAFKVEMCLENESVRSKIMPKKCVGAIEGQRVHWEKMLVLELCLVGVFEKAWHHYAFLSVKCWPLHQTLKSIPRSILDNLSKRKARLQGHQYKESCWLWEEERSEDY